MSPARRAGRPCPVCRTPASEFYRPFCSKRCADVDLGRWVTGRYAIPAAEEDDPESRAAPMAIGAKPPS